MNIEGMKRAISRVKVALGITKLRPACSVCGRPLYAASSIERGMGNVCAGRHAKKDIHTIDMFEGGTVGSEHGCG